MERDQAEQFNDEVERYRRMLLDLARRNERERFQTTAGKMFDYIESIEFRELERRFFKNFFRVLAGLIALLALFFAVDFEIHRDWIQFKNTFLLSMLAASCYEVYFYLIFQRYAKNKAVLWSKRRERFVRGIEQDFNAYLSDHERKAA